jgi:hypothetical protein
MALAAAAAWQWRWQIGGSVAGRKAAVRRRGQLSFRLAAAVEARQGRWWRQRGDSGSSLVVASSKATVSAAWCWQRKCGGSINRVAEAVQQWRGDGGQPGGVIFRK